MALFVIFLNFLQYNLPRFSQHTASSVVQFCIGDFFLFLQIHVFCRGKKNWSYRFPLKSSADFTKIFIASLPNFTEFPQNARKFSISFASLAHVKSHKASKNTDVFLGARVDDLNLSIRPQRACDRKTIRSQFN